MRLQRLFPVFLLTLLLLTLWCWGVGVTIDGDAVEFSQESGIPFVDENSRTLVPLRAVMEAYGCAVDWESGSHTATVTLDGVTVRVPVGSSSYEILSDTFPMDTAAVIRDGRTYLPIRFVLEAFGAQVDWDGNTSTVVVRHRQRSDLQVHFLDVGQADAILVTDGNAAMLLDAGNNDDGTAIVRYLAAHGVRHLDYAVGTHPHEDHVGGLDTVLNAVPTDRLLLSAATAESKTYRDVLTAAQEHLLSPIVPETGTAYCLGGSEFTIVNALKTDDANNASLMLRLVRRDTSFLFANGYSFLWLIVLYCLGGLLAKNRTFREIPAILGVCLFLFGVALTYRFFRLAKPGYTEYTSPTVLIEAIGLLIAFQNVKIKNRVAGKLIRLFGEATLGVYLIHTHPLV